MIFWSILFLNACFIAESPHMIRRLLVILIFIHVATLALEDYSVFRRLIVILAATGGICALLSVLVHAFQGNLVFAYRASPIHGSGLGNLAEFGGTIIAGTNYVPSLVAAIWLALTATRKDMVVKWLACAFFIAVFVYFTYSRTAWLASLASAVILVMTQAKPEVKKLTLLAGMIIVIFACIFGYDAIQYELTERGTTGRDEIWSTVFERLSGHWLTGYGAGVNTDPIAIHGGAQIIKKHMHNLYIEILYQFGLIGLVLTLVVSLLLVLELFRLRANKMAAFWLALFSCGLLAMLFDLDGFVSSPSVVWIYFWLPIAGHLAIVQSDFFRKNIENAK